MNEIQQLVEISGAALPTQAYCLPGQVNNVFDTVKFWAMIFAGFAAFVGLVMVGTGLVIASRRHDGGQIFQSLAPWLIGVLIIASAGALVGVFLPGGGNCIPVPGS